LQETNRILQGLGIPHSALLSIIFGMMLLSFPIGAYVFFNSDIGRDITHEYPLGYADSAFAPLLETLPFEVGLGDGFIVIWSAFVILFAVGMLGPKQNFIRTLVPILSFGRDSSSNYLVSVLKWFGVLVFASAVIDLVQGGFGITMEPPDFGNDLTRFFAASLAPFVEEIGFRVILVGLPLYAMFYRRASLRGLISSLWHPFSNLDVTDSKRVLALVVGAGVLFGLAHVLLEDSWSGGKLTQAAVGGVIVGWVYYRHGLLAAIMLHWATNYFVFSYVYFVAFLNDVSASDAYSHSLLGVLELLFVASGAVSLAFLIASHYRPGASGDLEAS